MHLKDKLHTLKMKESDSVTKHVHLFRSYLENLAAARCSIADEEAILALIQSLPPSYRIFISSLRRQLSITLQSLITDLIQEETLMKDMNWNNENQLALYTKRKFYNNDKKTFFPKGESSKQFERKNESLNKRICFYCKKRDHSIQDCRNKIVAEKRNPNRRKNNTVTKSNNLYVVTALITQEQPTSSWYVDSGATQHMCHEFDAFLNYKTYKNQQLVYLGDDSTSYKIEGHGDVNIRLMNGIEKLIPDVLHVPGLAKNLFSAKQLDKVGGEIRIKCGQLTLINKFDKTIANCQLNPNLYELSNRIIPNKKILAIPATTHINKVDLSHLRMGHINKHRLKQLHTISRGMDSFNENDMTFCQSCIIGKQHKQNIPKGGATRATQLLELIHSDIGGPTQVETHSGIKQEYTAAYTLQQNGVSERKNRTLVGAILSMLSYAKLLKAF